MIGGLSTLHSRLRAMASRDPRLVPRLQVTFFMFVRNKRHFPTFFACRWHEQLTAKALTPEPDRHSRRHMATKPPFPFSDMPIHILRAGREEGGRNLLGVPPSLGLPRQQGGSWAEEEEEEDTLPFRTQAGQDRNPSPFLSSEKLWIHLDFSLISHFGFGPSISLRRRLILKGTIVRNTGTCFEYFEYENVWRKSMFVKGDFGTDGGNCKQRKRLCICIDRKKLLALILP